MKVWEERKGKERKVVEVTFLSFEVDVLKGRF